MKRRRKLGCRDSHHVSGGDHESLRRSGKPMRWISTGGWATSGLRGFHVPMGITGSITPLDFLAFKAPGNPAPDSQQAGVQAMVYLPLRNSWGCRYSSNGLAPWAHLRAVIFGCYPSFSSLDHPLTLRFELETLEWGQNWTEKIWRKPGCGTGSGQARVNDMNRPKERFKALVYR